MSKTYALKFVQQIPCSPETAWKFFSDPVNLARITPTAFGFKTISRYHGNIIYPGQIIEYRVRPALGIPFYWMTEITHVEEGKFFVDEQRYGPFSLWHHQHLFREIAGGVEMTDIVHYKIPFWLLGDLANTFIVKRKLKELFQYRFDQTAVIFGKWPKP
jgi:ligand-binding SRPBCC domain-containing protein